MEKRLFTSECVTCGHPDKVADCISDAILDACLAQDPGSRVACETMVTTNFCIICGEITTKAQVDYEAIARRVIRQIGYVYPGDNFDAEEQMKDSSSGSIMASALIELYGHTSNKEYLAVAERQLRSLSSPAYLAEVGENGNFVLKHGTGHLPAGTEVDVPLTYGDYYFIEAAMRYLAL